MQRTLNVWNSLPNHVVSAPNIALFKRQLDCYWEQIGTKAQCLNIFCTNFCVSITKNNNYLQCMIRNTENLIENDFQVTP